MPHNGAHADFSQLPLAGVIMCCTSIPAEQRSELAHIAAEMGAISKLDLTSEVTHLIIGDIDTPKYRYVAKEREDVKVLLPGWIHAVREKWMSGSDNLDLFTLEREYRAPTFYKLRICITGFDDLATRKNIEEIANMNGAVYKGDLSKDITHLIAHSTHLAKYIYAKQWGLKVVALEWFQQSLDRGMVLDERLYDPLMERRERGKGAWQRKSPTATNLGKRQRGDNSPLTTTTAQSRRLRRSASSRFDSQNDGLWTNIVAAVPQAPRTNTTSEWDDNGGGQVNGHGFRRPTTATNTRHPEELPQMPSKPKGIFFETLFVLYGFDEKKTTILQKHLQSHDGVVLATLSESSDASIPSDCLILIPHTLRLRQLPTTIRQGSNMVGTDLWFEKCLHTKTFVKMGSNPIYKTFAFPTKGFENLIISSTAFEGIDLLQMSKVIHLIGGKYDEFLTRKTSVLMCNDSAMSRDKIKHALEWQIPAVNPDWLWDSIRNREVQNLKSYLLYPAAQQHLQLALPVDADLVDKDPAFADLKDLNEQKEKQGSDENAAQPRPDPEVNDDSEHKTQVAPFVEDDEPIYLPTVEDESKEPASKEEEILEPSKTLDKPLLQPLPLQERSPNSPTKPKSQPTKPHEEKSLAQRQAADRAILSDTLQTILSRQKSSGSAENLRRTASSGSARGTSTRREKRLLGRATSNLSVRSGNGAIVLGLNTNLSRASSIDTLHTDGLGTPIEGLPSAPLFAPSRMNSKEEQTSLTASALTSHDELLAADDDEHDQGHQHLQMTQVGYEDPEAGRWRAKFLKKITASKANKNSLDVEDDTAADTGPIESASRGGLLEDEPHVAGPSRRTRRR